MRSREQKTIKLQGRTVDYRIIRSKTARHLRVRVGLNGVEVLQPSSRRAKDAAEFLRINGSWVSEQLDRVKNLKGIRQEQLKRESEVLFQGRPTSIRIERLVKHSGNKILLDGRQLVLQKGDNSPTPLARSLENWLRKQARQEIQKLLAPIIARLKRSPNRIYVMGQRTKWGNCSAKKNLSFNWRLIMAPEFVFRYFVTHEAVHLAVADHSPKFWLTVQSLCPETQKARQWLRV